MPNFYSPTGNLEVWDVKPKGYMTYEEWDAAGRIGEVLAPPPTEEEIREARRAEIPAELAEIDQASIRPLRAEIAGSATQADLERLAGLELKAAGLRAELAALAAAETEG